MRAFRPVALALAVLAAVPGCSKKNSTAPADESSSAQLVAQANAALGAAIAAMVSGPGPGRPSDIDLRQPYNLYQQALAKDPLNKDAMFGSAVLGLVTLTSDASVNAAFDEWAAYLSLHDPFEVPPTPGPMGVPLRFGTARDALRLPYENVPRAQAALVRNVLGAPDPQLSGLQSILELRALPRLNEALAYLGTVASDPNYQFIVTPAMQGDPGADPVEIDVTDILALRAGCGILAAMCDMAVAYDVSFATYDSAGLVQAFTPGSGWMTLRTNGAARLTDARTSILGAVDDGEDCLAALAAEVDDQSDDVIKIDPGSFTSASAESVKVYLGHVRTALTTGFLITDDWDGDPGTPPVALEIQPGAFFTTPIPDWKALLPDYTAGAVRRPANISYTSNSYSYPLSVTVSSTAFYSAGWSVDASGGGVNESGFGNSELMLQIQVPEHDRFKTVQSNPLWGGSYSSSGFFSGNLVAGTQDIDVQHSEFYTYFEGEQFVPEIRWDAADFSQWIWPDPDMHGIFPGLATSAQFTSLFGFSASNWEPVLVLDWSGGGVPQP